MEGGSTAAADPDEPWNSAVSQVESSGVAIESCNKSAAAHVKARDASHSCISVDGVNFSALQIVESNASNASNVLRDMECDVFVSNVSNVSYVSTGKEGGVDWSKIEVAPMNDDDIDVPITEENMCLVLGIDIEGVQQQLAPSSITIDESVGTIDEDLFAEAAIPVNDDNHEEEHFIYDKDNPEIVKGSLFPSMAEFRKAITQFAINNEFDIKVSKTDTTRYMGHCRAAGCPWKITARLRADKKSIRVNKLVPIHECSSTSRVKTSMASLGWVADRSVSILQQDPSIGTKKLQTKLEDMYNCTIGYDTVWRGKDRALDKMYGSWGQSFQYLWNFKAEIEKRSPGSLVEIDVKTVGGEVYFSRFFMALKPCIEGFLYGCRPYISVDSTALNGKWNGHLAACTALDGHNWMFPVAFAFIDSETDANWTWFMTQLSRALGPIDTLAICTDACKGLENAVKKVFPQAEKRECFRHLMSNFVKKFHGDSFAHMWPAAKAYRPEVFDHHMLKVLQACPDVGGYLSKHHKLKWMRSSFNTEIKCDYIHNNLAFSYGNHCRI